jgi:hypothetical protein
MSEELLQVQSGVWISAQKIRDAGLGGTLRVLVHPGEIRIVPATEDEALSATALGWKTLISRHN